jgi:hypothetical protein
MRYVTYLCCRCIVRLEAKNRTGFVARLVSTVVVVLASVFEAEVFLEGKLFHSCSEL